MIHASGRCARAYTRHKEPGHESATLPTVTTSAAVDALGGLSSISTRSFAEVPCCIAAESRA
ncbi:hypothetical protein BaRGS_00019882, partial [Batillaria attramentaria]